MTKSSEESGFQFASLYRSERRHAPQRPSFKFISNRANSQALSLTHTLHARLNADGVMIVIFQEMAFQISRQASSRETSLPSQLEASRVDLQHLQR